MEISKTSPACSKNDHIERRRVKQQYVQTDRKRSCNDSGNYVIEQNQTRYSNNIQSFEIDKECLQNSPHNTNRVLAVKVGLDHDLAKVLHGRVQEKNVESVPKSVVMDCSCNKSTFNNAIPADEYPLVAEQPNWIEADNKGQRLPWIHNGVRPNDNPFSPHKFNETHVNGEFMLHKNGEKPQNVGISASENNPESLNQEEQVEFKRIVSTRHTKDSWSPTSKIGTNGTDLGQYRNLLPQPCGNLVDESRSGDGNDQSDMKPKEHKAVQAESYTSQNGENPEKLNKNTSVDLPVEIQSAMKKLLEAMCGPCPTFQENPSHHKEFYQSLSDFTEENLKQIMSTMNIGGENVITKKKTGNASSMSTKNCQQTTELSQQWINLVGRGETPHNVIDATQINVPRNPVVCPDSMCQRPIFLSEFAKHFNMDHRNIPLHPVDPLQPKSFFIDPRVIRFNITQCHGVLLLKGRIKNLGYNKFKDFIPILLMATKINLFDLYNKEDEKKSTNTDEFETPVFIIWLTGFEPPELSIFTTIKVLPHPDADQTREICGRLYSIRKSQDSKVIMNSGQALVLSEDFVKLSGCSDTQRLEVMVAIK